MLCYGDVIAGLFTDQSKESLETKMSGEKIGPLKKYISYNKLCLYLDLYDKIGQVSYPLVKCRKMLLSNQTVFFSARSCVL